MVNSIYLSLFCTAWSVQKLVDKLYLIWYRFNKILETIFSSRLYCNKMDMTTDFDKFLLNDWVFTFRTFILSDRINACIIYWLRITLEHYLSKYFLLIHTISIFNFKSQASLNSWELERLSRNKIFSLSSTLWIFWHHYFIWFYNIRYTIYCLFGILDINCFKLLI